MAVWLGLHRHCPSRKYANIKTGNPHVRAGKLWGIKAIITTFIDR
jgi:hypothetical protein